MLSKVPSCSCPDHAKGNLCKYILFVMLKVVGLESHSPSVYQAAYLMNELEDIVHRLKERRVSVELRSDVVAKAAVRRGFSDVSEKEGVGVSETPVEDILTYLRKMMMRLWKTMQLKILQCFQKTITALRSLNSIWKSFLS